IMQGTTPRSLSRAGLVAVLGLGLLLLPLLPIGAQTKDGKSDRPQTSKDPRDRQIEVLKEAIKILEAQKAADWKKVEHDKALQLDLKEKARQKREHDKALGKDIREKVKQKLDKRQPDVQDVPKANEEVIRKLKAEVEHLKALYNAKEKELQVLGKKY